MQSNIVRLQSMEPAGIGAANLSDCLVLQLQRMTPVNSVAVQIAASFLDQLAKQQTGTIAKALGVTRAEVHEACELIRTLNPRPMNGLGTRSETPYILPDFYITEENGQLHVIMNDYYLPKIIIDPTYQQIIQSGTLDKPDQEYIQKNYKEAAEIVNFISYRKSTMQKVMQYILHAQKAFFLSGPGHRTAMNNAEIAAAPLSNIGRSLAFRPPASETHTSTHNKQKRRQDLSAPCLYIFRRHVPKYEKCI